MKAVIFILILTFNAYSKTPIVISSQQRVELMGTLSTWSEFLLAVRVAAGIEAADFVKERLVSAEVSLRDKPNLVIQKGQIFVEKTLVKFDGDSLNYKGFVIRYDLQKSFKENCINIGRKLSRQAVNWSLFSQAHADIIDNLDAFERRNHGALSVLNFLALVAIAPELAAGVAVVGIIGRGVKTAYNAKTAPVLAFKDLRCDNGVDVNGRASYPEGFTISMSDGTSMRGVLSKSGGEFIFQVQKDGEILRPTREQLAELDKIVPLANQACKLGEAELTQLKQNLSQTFATAWKESTKTQPTKK